MDLLEHSEPIRMVEALKPMLLRLIDPIEPRHHGQFVEPPRPRLILLVEPKDPQEVFFIRLLKLRAFVAQLPVRHLPIRAFARGKLILTGGKIDLPEDAPPSLIVAAREPEIPEFRSYVRERSFS